MIYTKNHPEKHLADINFIAGRRAERPDHDDHDTTTEGQVVLEGVGH